MKKVLLAMLVLTAIMFAENINSNGDVRLVAVDDAREVLKAAVTEGFAIGTRATSEVIRDIWTGSDFDADGKKEVILASYGIGGRAYVYEIDGNNSATLFFDTGDFGSTYTSACRDAKYGDWTVTGCRN
jgi:hypothetical protein